MNLQIKILKLKTFRYLNHLHKNYFYQLYNKSNLLFLLSTTYHHNNPTFHREKKKSNKNRISFLQNKSINRPYHKN